MTTEVFALTFTGAPAVELRAGQWYLGGSYTYSEQDIEIADEVEVEDVEIETRLVRVGLDAITDRIELFGLAGGFSDDQGEFHGSPETALGGGAFGVAWRF